MNSIENWLKSMSESGKPRYEDINYQNPSPNSNISELIALSEKFPINFPIDTVRCKSLKTTVKEDILNKNINSAYPVIHEATLVLYNDFLRHKRQFGTDIEKELYNKIGLLKLVERFLKKRAVYFVGVTDKWMLINKSRGYGNWESVGSVIESGDFTLENCLSYDEIKLSALMPISSFTYFINDGNRMNDGIPVQNRENIEDEGVIIGLIGPRLEKEFVMDYQDILMEPNQNVESKGFGKNNQSSSVGFFSEFYQKPNWAYEEFLEYQKGIPANQSNFIDLGNGNYFDNLTYSKRLTLSFDTLLLEANDRAKSQVKSSYIHIVGIGLGVWAYSPHQTQIFMTTFAERLEALGEYLHSVSDVHFSYIRSETCGKYKNGEKVPVQCHPNGGIKIHISKREPHVKLIGEDAGKLLVVSYAWDGNAHPGNEFWYGSLHGSGDPAAACSTQVAEIHNAHINKVVCSENLRVATKNGLIRIDAYIKGKL